MVPDTHRNRRADEFDDAQIVVMNRCSEVAFEVGHQIEICAWIETSRAATARRDQHRGLSAARARCRGAGAGRRRIRVEAVPWMPASPQSNSVRSGG